MVNFDDFSEIRKIFNEACLHYTQDKYKIDKTFEVLFEAYSQKYRFYHNFYHIKHMIEVILPLRSKIKDWDSLIFSIFFHDYVYKPEKNYPNEEKSALYAKAWLLSLNIPNKRLKKIDKWILLTKYNEKEEKEEYDEDLFFLIDADLSQLGYPWITYELNSFLIKQEYNHLTEKEWINGRIQFLKSMLNRETIFLTDYFSEKFEKTAKENIQKELMILLQKM